MILESEPAWVYICVMESETILVATYLTKPRYSYGALVSVGFIAMCFLVSNVYWSNHPLWGDSLASSTVAIFEKKEYWRLWSTILVHGDLRHLLANTLMLLVMGYFVATSYGFIIYPLLSLLMGGVVNFLVLLTFDRDIHLVGASGVLYYLWGFWLVLFVLIERQVPLLRRFMKVILVGLVLLIPTTFVANTSYLSHALGFAFGALSAVIYFLIYHRRILSYEQYQMVENPEAIEMEEFEN